MIHPTFCSLTSRLRNAQHIPKAILEQRNPKHKPPFPLTHSYQIQSGPSASKRVRSYFPSSLGVSTDYHHLITCSFNDKEEEEEEEEGVGVGIRFSFVLVCAVQRLSKDGWMALARGRMKSRNNTRESISNPPSLPPSLHSCAFFSLSPKMSTSTPRKCGH